LILTTATTGGTYYPVGVAIATLISKETPLKMNAINSAGSAENIQMLENHEADLAILQGLFGAMAWSGKGRYQGQPEREFRSITMLWPNVEHFVVSREFVETGNIEDLLDDGFVVFHTDEEFLIIVKGCLAAPSYLRPIAVIEFSINRIRRKIFHHNINVGSRLNRIAGLKTHTALAVVAHLRF